MGLATTQSAVWIYGRIQRLVIEAHLSQGLPGFTIVGLATTAIKESKERVRSAIINAGFKFPQQRVTINLSLGNLPKSGAETDLAIAVALLLASNQIDEFYSKHFLFAGELGLDGRVNPCDQQLAFSCCAASHKLNLMAAINSPCICPTVSIEHLSALKSSYHQVTPASTLTPKVKTHYWSQIAGNEFLKWLVFVALCGRHSLLLWGPPGTGKTLIAKAMNEIQPSLSFKQAVEVGHQRNNLNFAVAPFCMPHHSVSSAAMGGSSKLHTTPIVAQANNGILFLDELHEFSIQTLDQLRQPIEDNTIHISRATIDIKLDANFQLIATTNPCKCGYLGSTTKSCQCSLAAVKKHQSRVSGPLLDRFNINYFVEQQQPVDDSYCSVDLSCEFKVRSEVNRIRQLQLERQGVFNSALTLKQLSPLLADLVSEVDELIDRQKKGAMSFRHLLSVLQLAVTLADTRNQNASLADLVFARMLCERVIPQHEKNAY